MVQKQAKYGYLSGIFGWFGALRGAPGVGNGCRVGTNHKDLTYDGFKGAAPLSWAKYGYLGGIFVCSGALRGVSRERDGWCATSGRWKGRTNQKELKFDGIKGAVPLFIHKKRRLSQIWLSIWYFWSLWGSEGGPWDAGIGDAPPWEGDGLGLILKTEHLIV